MNAKKLKRLLMVVAIYLPCCRITRYPLLSFFTFSPRRQKKRMHFETAPRAGAFRKAPTRTSSRKGSGTNSRRTTKQRYLELITETTRNEAGTMLEVLELMRTSCAIHYDMRSNKRIQSSTESKSSRTSKRDANDSRDTCRQFW